MEASIFFPGVSIHDVVILWFESRFSCKSLNRNYNYNNSCILFTIRVNQIYIGGTYRTNSPKICLYISPGNLNYQKLHYLDEITSYSHYLNYQSKLADVC